MWGGAAAQGASALRSLAGAPTHANRSLGFVEHGLDLAELDLDGSLAASRLAIGTRHLTLQLLHLAAPVRGRCKRIRDIAHGRVRRGLLLAQLRPLQACAARELVHRSLRLKQLGQA